MPIERLRDIGKLGIITDIDPYDLPTEAWSAGVNVRFRNNKVTSAPVFRSVLHTNLPDPRYVFAAITYTGDTNVFVGYKSGNVHYYANGAETDYTPTGYTTSAVDATWYAIAADSVVYMNRADRTPWYLLPSQTQFQNLSVTPPASLTTTAATATTSNVLTFASVPATGLMYGMSVYSSGIFVGFVNTWTTTTITLVGNAAVPVASGTALNFSGHWDATWRAQIIAQCGGAMVALNLTKGPTAYPNLIKTASPFTGSTIPWSWDINQPSTLATETNLGSMDGPIVEAASLGSDLIIYGRRECWRMHADASVFVYTYTKLPFRKGAISANCCYELDGKNYCFGIDDIWVHDGISEESLCDQQVRDYIFSSINMAQANKCFIQLNPRLNELYFCYVSGDQNVNYVGVDGCNRAAVYNLTTKTWTFDDLPSIWFATDAPLPNFMTYASATATYTTIGGSYQDQEDGDKRVTTMVGSLSTTYNLSSSIYAYDVHGAGSVAAFPVDQNATGPRYLERTGIDLNELNTDLRGYKQLSTIYPQARVDVSGGNYMMVSVGASDNINDTSANWSPYVPYDGDTNYKLDFNYAGRWLGIRIQWSDYRALTITGFDLDIKVTGNR